MGDPRRPRRTFSKPRSPWRSDQLAQELYLLGSYGLRNKRELWRAQTALSSIRKQARHLLAASEIVRNREEKKLLDSLQREGLVAPGVALDDVLSLSIEDMLSRRLQTIVYKKGQRRFASPGEAAHSPQTHQDRRPRRQHPRLPGQIRRGEAHPATGGIGTPKAPEPKPAMPARAHRRTDGRKQPQNRRRRRRQAQ